MTDGRRYSRVVLTCIVLTVGVSYAAPRRLTLSDKDGTFHCEVNIDSATAHSGFLQNLVEDVPEHLIRSFALERVAEKELRLFADYIAKVHANDGRSTTRRWVRVNLPSLADRMRMLEVAQYLQMCDLEQCIASMEYTSADIAWILRETHLAETTLERIVEGTPAYRMLRDADVKQDGIQQKEAIVEEIRALLITGHGNIDLVNNGWFDFDFTVLHWATTENHPEVVELLLSITGVTVTDFPLNRDDFVSPLQCAVHYGSTRLVELLLQFPGIEVDAGAGTGSGTALHVAAAKYDDYEGSDGTRIVELLIEHGADVDALDGGGRTALHLAVQNGREDLVKVLLDHGANLNHQDRLQGRTPLHEAVAWNQAACVARLMSNVNIEINLKDSKGRTIYDHPYWRIVRNELARK